MVELRLNVIRDLCTWSVVQSWDSLQWKLQISLKEIVSVSYLMIEYNVYLYREEFLKNKINVFKSTGKLSKI